MKVSPFTYLWYWLLYPKNRIFLDEGFGIEARYKRGGWEEHLSKSKLFIADSLAKIGSVDSILILGAGRLYDCDLELISKFTGEIILLDADPRAVASWPKKVGKTKVYSLCLDATGVFENWRELLVKGSKNFLNPDSPSFPQSDMVISLNLKSQLSVLFREYVGRSVPDLEARLQENHVLDVFNQSRKAALFLYDSYYRYKKDGFIFEEESLDLAPINLKKGWREILKRDWIWDLEKEKILHNVVGKAYIRINFE